MNLGKTIRNIRKKKGLSQKELANLSDTYPSHISAIELGLKPRFSTLENIANALNVPLPIVFFLSMTEDDIPDNKREGFRIISPSVYALINEFFH